SAEAEVLPSTLHELSTLARKPMTRVLSDAFSGALRDQRAGFNQRFEQARHMYPLLQGDDVLWFLRECVDDAVADVPRANPAAVASLVSSACDAALALCGQKLVGPSGKYPAIGEGWRRVLPAAAALLAREPARIIAAVSNALHKLAASPGTRPDEWIGSLERV